MAIYVPDVKTKRWVIISETRSSRPDDIKSTVHHAVPQSGTNECPFCVGNEHMTPPEVYRIGTGGKEESGWQVRVVPNKYAITDTHEVFIHSPQHDLEISQLPLQQVTRIITAYRDRYAAHVEDGHVIIFCNHGKTAGASLAHPHSQLVVVPRQISLDSLSREPMLNSIETINGYVSYCPDFSQWPYEVWISPTQESRAFGEVGDNELLPIAEILQRTLRRIRAIHDMRQESKKNEEKEPFVYNYYISHSDHWFIRVIPRFIHRAGFELGTGLSVNTIAPKNAASQLSLVAVG